MCFMIYDWYYLELCFSPSVMPGYNKSKRHSILICSVLFTTWKKWKLSLCNDQCWAIRQWKFITTCSFFISFKLCMMVVHIKLYLLVSVSVTLIMWHFLRSVVLKRWYWSCIISVNFHLVKVERYKIVMYVHKFMCVSAIVSLACVSGR